MRSAGSIRARSRSHTSPLSRCRSRRCVGATLLALAVVWRKWGQAERGGRVGVRFGEKEMDFFFLWFLAKYRDCLSTHYVRYSFVWFSVMEECRRLSGKRQARSIDSISVRGESPLALPRAPQCERRYTANRYTDLHRAFHLSFLIKAR